MSAPVSLLFGVHAHQPAGNFPSVVDEAHEKSYGPFLRTVYRYPEFRFAAHFSGWLLAYLLDHYPDDMALLREMVARRQAELFGGGDMEPVLASIPARDRLGQLDALANRLERAFGVRPHGAWLTERVWEATVVPSLAAAQVSYVTVDDYHFVCAGRDLPELTGYFTTEDDGRRLDLFPISEQLRYRIPFAPADEVVRYIESFAGSGRACAAIYFDDIEKFGIWPETYDWVYTRRWLEKFIEGVLASPLVQPRLFRDFHDKERTRGIVYLPTTSYMEMGEWSLPAHRADEFAALIEQEKSQGRYDRFKPFLRGGIWRNFLSRYPEANWMHKRTLDLSERFEALAPADRTEAQRDLLYRAQANDAYWHGLFGGIYLPHLRRAVWNAAVELEASLDAVSPRPPFLSRDADADGCIEIFLHDHVAQAVVRDDAEAAVIEWSHYRLRHNFGDTLARRREHYYRHLDSAEQARTQGDGIASAHDRVAFRHEIRAEDARADDHPRSSFVDRFDPSSGSPSQHPRYHHHLGDRAAFAGTLGGGRVSKSYTVADGALEARYELDTVEGGTLRVELNLAMPSCDGFLGRYVADGEILGGFGQPLDRADARSITLEDGVLGGRVSVNASTACRLTAVPLFTVSQSEAGFEKVMQAVTMVLAFPIGLGQSVLTVRMEAKSA